MVPIQASEGGISHEESYRPKEPSSQVNLDTDEKRNNDLTNDEQEELTSNYFRAESER